MIYNVSGLRTLLCATLAAILSGVVCFAIGRGSEYLSADASWWQDTVPAEGKVYVVQGGIDAYLAGWKLGKMGARMQDLMDRVHLKAKPGSPAALMIATPTFSRSYGSYITGITSFYKTYPEATSATVGEILTCLSDKPAFECAGIAKDH